MNIQAARTTSAEAVLLREDDGRSPCSRSTGRRRATACRGSCCERSGTSSRHRRRPQRARRRDRRQRPGILRRPRPQGDDGAPHRCRRRPRLFPAHHETCSAMMQQIVSLPQPVIAAVQGVATAAGCQLVATCDLAVARPRRASPRRASISACSARRRWWRCRATCRASTPWRCCSPATSSPPTRPRRIGLVNAWCRRGARARGASSSRSKIAAKSSHVIGIGKEAFYRQLEMPLAEAYATPPGDDREHAGARRRGRHLRLHREARADWETDDATLPADVATCAAAPAGLRPGR